MKREASSVRRNPSRIYFVLYLFEQKSSAQLAFRTTRWITGEGFVRKRRNHRVLGVLIILNRIPVYSVRRLALSDCFDFNTVTLWVLCLYGISCVVLRVERTGENHYYKTQQISIKPSTATITTKHTRKIA